MEKTKNIRNIFWIYTLSSYFYMLVLNIFSLSIDLLDNLYRYSNKINILKNVGTREM